MMGAISNVLLKLVLFVVEVLQQQLILVLKSVETEKILEHMRVMMETL